ncbi:hypothetical protein BO71DRAFT_181571 [Aspergillus ellipticus CBS 707.79]|uniref:Uncharacterized protein n=1 Tax=Aspergillus ellipticus CBS 707.79 TaxID=1448320 RepID=A0A319DFU8_9EURO|nr:hypothetical protein BO71DRAFT_181571 [Aspergillus ellipticus CBS 707.79]
MAAEKTTLWDANGIGFSMPNVGSHGFLSLIICFLWRYALIKGSILPCGDKRSQKDQLRTTRTYEIFPQSRSHNLLAMFVWCPLTCLSNGPSQSNLCKRF